MNRGEWGEPYVALMLLGYKRLYLSDEQGRPNNNEWMDILKVIRQEAENRTVEYTLTSDNVEIEVNGNYVLSIENDQFQVMAEKLKTDILESTGRTFDVSPDVISFLNEVEIRHMKAKSIDKSDIFVSTRDPRSSIVREKIGFSIKCEFGERPTLFNTAKASAVKYQINGMTESLMNKVNSLFDEKGHVPVSDRCRTILDNGCTMEYVGYETATRAKCEAFKENLWTINPNLPMVIQSILWNHFIEKQTEVDVASVMQRVVEENPCNISLPEMRYPYMMKMFLYSAFCGLTASTIWNGESDVRGGYISVNRFGEVVANYAMESEAFKSFLYAHCYFDFPSTDLGHGAYGEIYKTNDKYFFKLNFQIRMR